MKPHRIFHMFVGSYISLNRSSYELFVMAISITGYIHRMTQPIKNKKKRQEKKEEKGDDISATLRLFIGSAL